MIYIRNYLLNGNGVLQDNAVYRASNFLGFHLDQRDVRINQAISHSFCPHDTPPVLGTYSLVS